MNMRDQIKAAIADYDHGIDNIVDRILEITKVEVKGEDVAIAEAQWNGMPIEHWHKHIAFIDGSLEAKHTLDTANDSYYRLSGELKDKLSERGSECEMEWIGIADAMPKQGQYCIVAADGIGQFLAVLWNGSEFIWADGAEYGAPAYDPLPSEKVTHWMKFPDDPTKNDSYYRLSGELKEECERYRVERDEIIRDAYVIDADVDEFTNSMQWVNVPENDYEKTLVVGNIRGFASFLNRKWENLHALDATASKEVIKQGGSY
jgi:hypothetical protein